MMSDNADIIAYNRALYWKSPKHRLARINHARRRRGSPEIASLDQAGMSVPRRGSDGRFEKVLP